MKQKGGGMVRTQIYLSENEQKFLKSIAVRTGKKQSELIRKAVDNLIDSYGCGDRKSFLRKAKGLWKDRKDLPDFYHLRKELDRNP
jgi:hypothetical protein